MKKITIVIAMILCVNLSYSQTKFEYKKADTPTQIIGWKSTMNNNVVIQSAGTAAENYAKVLDYVKVTYNRNMLILSFWAVSRTYIFSPTEKVLNIH